MDFAPGQVIAERYRVVESLGVGGMGAVYLVEDVTSKQKYALKTILASGATDRNLKRFVMETKATRLLEHPNLVRIHDFGFITESQPYFVMDFFEGKNLSDMIKDEGPFPVDKAIEVFSTICHALTYAHTQGVVHRDLKPSNVMITRGEIKVLDFGIAKVLRDGTEFNTLTQTGEIFGSPYYMSREQCLGKSVDLRSDVYSLGCMFFETLTGAPPLSGETPVATMLKHQCEDPPTLKQATLGKDFSPDLEKIVSLMLAKNPGNRYQDLLRVADDLRHVQRGEPLENLNQAKVVKPIHKGILAIGLAVLTLGAVTAVYLMQPQAKNAEMHTFMNTNASDKLPRIEDAGKISAEPPRGYYSVKKSNNDKVRDFQFPWHSFGDYGYTENTYDYKPTIGKHTNVRIPFFLNIKQDPAGIAGFRNDEVCSLILRGYLVQDKTTDAIKEWHEVTSLDMDDTDISDASIANFKRLPKLTDLSICDTNITADGLGQLALEKMKTLNINRIRGARSLLPRLGRSERLSTLKMIADGITDEDMKVIGQIKNLNLLDLRDNPVSDEGIKPLTGLMQLKHLYIEGSKITPESIVTLKKLSRLRALKIENCPWNNDEKSAFRRTLKRANRALRLDITSVSKRVPKSI